jgi:hypothetical protein
MDYSQSYFSWWGNNFGKALAIRVFPDQIPVPCYKQNECVQESVV